MVEIECSTTCIYMRIRMVNVLGNRGVCRDTTGGTRAFVVFHAVVGVKSAQPGDVYRCVPNDRLTRDGVSKKMA